MSDETIRTVNVRLSQQIIKILDDYIESGVYSSRSELIRDLCRNYVLEERNRNE